MNWFRRFMIGRHGLDKLGFALLAVSLFLTLLSSFWHNNFLYIAAMLTMAVCYFRILSRNSQKRWAENNRFVNWWDPITTKVTGKARSIKDLKTHCHLKCPSCGQKIRVPRGRGKISITCPGCGTTLVKKT